MRTRVACWFLEREPLEAVVFGVIVLRAEDDDGITAAAAEALPDPEEG